jgi:hypothetical protein
MTAIEWLVEQVNSDCLNSSFIRPELIEEAKELEKKQIIDTVLSCASFIGYEEAEYYYNETFKK